MMDLAEIKAWAKTEYILRSRRIRFNWLIAQVDLLTAERDRYKAALERIAGYDFSAFAGIEGPVGLAKEALTAPSQTPS